MDPKNSRKGAPKGPQNGPQRVPNRLGRVPWEGAPASGRPPGRSRGPPTPPGAPRDPKMEPKGAPDGLQEGPGDPELGQKLRRRMDVSRLLPKTETAGMLGRQISAGSPARSSTSTAPGQLIGYCGLRGAAPPPWPRWGPRGGPKTAPMAGRKLAESCPRNSEHRTGKSFRAPVSRSRFSIYCLRAGLARPGLARPG